MDVEVLARQAAESLSWIPDSLRDYLKGAGLRPSFTRRDEDNTSLLFGLGTEELLLDDIPEDLMDDERGLTVREVCKKAFKISDGALRRGDCLLVVTPIEVWERRQRTEDQMRRQREDPVAALEALEQEMQQALRSASSLPGPGKHSGRPVLQLDGKPLS